MPNFDNLDDLFNYIDKDITLSLSIVAENVKHIMRNYILEEQYNWTPLDYQRTYDYINSLSISPILHSNNGISIEIYFDPNKIKPSDAPNGSTWNRHEDIHKNPVNNSIPFWLEEGNGDSPYYQYSGNHVVANTIAECELNGIHIQKLITELQSKGYDIVL